MRAAFEGGSVWVERLQTFRFVLTCSTTENQTAIGFAHRLRPCAGGRAKAQLATNLNFLKLIFCCSLGKKKIKIKHVTLCIYHVACFENLGNWLEVVGQNTLKKVPTSDGWGVWVLVFALSTRYIHGPLTKRILNINFILYAK